MMILRTIAVIATAAFLAACGSQSAPENNKPENDNKQIQDSVQTYLDHYNNKYKELAAAASEAHWKANTMIVEGDTVTGKQAAEAEEAMAKFTGSKENIETANNFLEQKDKLTDLQVKQLNAILYMAASKPEIAGDVVKELIEANTKQTEMLYGYKFTVDGKEITPNEIDKQLKESNDVNKRLKVWASSKEVGKTLKDGLANLQQLRNKSVQAMGYSDYFAYQVAEYGINTDELRKITQDMIKEVWPLYRELHTYARYELAEKYGQEVPEMLPAHWLPNRWGQDWTPLVHVEGLNVDSALETKTAEWIVESGEKFYTSIGFNPLPKSFYEKSSLYPLPENAEYKKNTHASAWHLDLDQDVRSLMSVEPNSQWWETALHELGHIYYFMEYSNKDVPIVLRAGANRAYHEAMGSLIGLAAMQKPFLVEFGLIDENAQTDETTGLLKEAMNYIVLIPWASGVMTDFEYELYANNLPEDQYNAKWWELKKKYQGIVPPAERGEEYCDAATKTHINDDAAQYYDYAMSNVLLFQFHDHISKKILNQDPHATNYYGNKEVGKFLKAVMYPGATEDWNELLKKHIGEGMSARAMVEYFRPLMDHLKKANEGRTHTLPEKMDV